MSRKSFTLLFCLLVVFYIPAHADQDSDEEWKEALSKAKNRFRLGNKETSHHDTPILKKAIYWEWMEQEKADLSESEEEIVQEIQVKIRALSNNPKTIDEKLRQLQKEYTEFIYSSDIYY
ncbi:uncharacterized protein LOC141858787 [Brevipalpus obovatus]|uniref:uncharacterized protein LOC141858787 n=1 Tax=Brevipalpus obovatus TaxID=246614 RepID=UPI003D9E06B4